LHERARLLYVAATRARSELHLFGELRETGAGQGAMPPSGTLLATLWPAIAADFPLEPETAGGSGEIRALHMPPLRRLPSDWRLPEIAAGPEATGMAIATYQPRNEAEFLCTADVSHCIGVVVCEQLRSLRTGVLPVASAWEMQRAVLQSRFVRLGLTGEGLQVAVERAIETLKARSADAKCQWLFAPTHTQIASPLELTGMHDGRLASVSVDRAFVDAGGTRWLIDYKPGVPLDGEVTNFQTREMERERPTLERYIAFARAWGQEPARTGLYFPLFGAFIEL
jgi:ATP-dependent helicase/nuclease subunit A